MKKVWMALGLCCVAIILFVQHGGISSMTTDDSTPPAPSNPSQSQTTNVDVYVDEEEPQPWAGPGWYYGLWFVNAYDYDAWCNNHWHGRDGHRHHHDHHHDHRNHHRHHGHARSQRHHRSHHHGGRHH